MAVSETSCLTERSSTAYGKHRSSSKNGGNTTTRRDHTVHWVIVHQLLNHHTHRSQTNHALTISLAQSDEAAQGDLNSFLADTGRKKVDKRLWMQTTNKMEAKAEKTLKDQDKPVTDFRLNDFREAQIDYPERFAAIH